MRPRLTLAAIGLIAASAAASPFASAMAGAAPALCTGHEQMSRALKEKFGETRQVVGLVGGSGLMEIYVSPAGTWTMVMTDPQKLSCILAAGHSWDQMPPARELTGLTH